jgi:hypothetical protein
MATFWSSVTVSEEEKGPWNSTEDSTDKSRAGYIVYARQKADMYRRMASSARERFKSAGGDWPRESETVAESPAGPHH